MATYSSLRWLISMTDRPLPCQSSISAWARSRTAVGRAAGPAQKLWARFTSFSLDSPHTRPPGAGAVRAKSGAGAPDSSILVSPACYPGTRRAAPGRPYVRLNVRRLVGVLARFGDSVLFALERVILDVGRLLDTFE